MVWLKLGIKNLNVTCMLNYGTISVQKVQNLDFNISKKQFRKCYQGHDFFNNLCLVLMKIVKEGEGALPPIRWVLRA